MTLVGIAVLHGRGPARQRRAGAPRTRARLTRTAARGRPDRRPAARPLDLPGRVRLRRAAVPVRLPADADHARRRRRAGRSRGSRRPRRGARRGRLLPRSCAARWRCWSGPVLGETTPHFPLYVVEALVVEAIALRVPTRPAAALRALVRPRDRHRRPRRRVGAGRTSGCRCPGRRRCSPRRRSLGFAAAMAGGAARRLDRRAPGGRRRGTGRPQLRARRGLRRRRRWRRWSPSRSTRPPTRASRARSRCTEVDAAAPAARCRPTVTAQPARRRRRRRVARPSPPGRAAGWSSTGCARSARAATGPPSRSRSTATGRR